MKVNESLEQLKFAISRYDHYYDSVNNKGNLYLTINTFILGGSLTGYYSIHEQVCIEGFCYALFWILLFSCIISISLTLFAIKPYLNSKLDNTEGSLLYFGDVSLLKFKEFENRIQTLTEEKQITDFTKQTYLLAIGLRRKFRLLKWSTYLIAFEFICVIIIGLLIIK
jgi:hypothetical protein